MYNTMLYYIWVENDTNGPGTVRTGEGGQHETRTNFELKQAGKKGLLTQALGIDNDGMA